MQIKTVLRGGAAEQAGFAAGDEWLGAGAGRTGQGRPPDGRGLAHEPAGRPALYAGEASKVIALVARDKRLLRLPLTLPPALTTWRLAVSMRRGQRWLDPWPELAGLRLAWRSA